MPVTFKHSLEGISLEINGGQAMQTWERALMEESARLLTRFGTRFLEVGLGFGFSALAIAREPSTQYHLVIEKEDEVIDRFRRHHPVLPSSLEIIQGDAFEHLPQFGDESFDGIFFDPALPLSVWRDAEFWKTTMPNIFALLRPGGAFVPFFSTTPDLRWQYLPYFSKIMVLRRHFRAFTETTYTHGTEGIAYIQCFVKEGYDEQQF